MNIWKRWIWPGLFVTAALTALAVWSMQHVIQTDLETRFNEAAKAEGIDWAIIRIDGRDGYVSGTAPDETGLQALQSLVLTVDGLLVQAVDIDLLPLADPYEFSLSREADSATATGHIPYNLRDGGLIKLLAEAVSSVQIIDETTVARGAPDEFRERVLFAGSILEKLSAGAVHIIGNDIAVSGEALDHEAYAQLQSFLNTAIPAGLTLTGTEISAPVADPYVFFAIRDGDSFLLNGFVPDQAILQKTVDAASTISGSGDVESNLKVASGALVIFEKQVDVALKALAFLEVGTAQIDGEQLIIEGQFANVDASIAYENFIAALPADLAASLTSRVQTRARTSFTFSARKDGNNLSLQGMVPAEKFRNDLKNFLNSMYPNGMIGDETVLQSPAPEVFELYALAALGLLDGLSAGTAIFENNAFTINGKAKTPSDFDAIQAALAQIPEIKGDISPSEAVGDYVWSAVKSEDGIVMSGSVPSAELRANLMAQAADLFTGFDVASTLSVESGAPEGFAQKAIQVLEWLTYLENGEVSLLNGRLAVRGAAKSVSAFDALNKILSEQGAAADSVITPAIVSPYTWSVDRTDGGSVLNGFVPDQMAGRANEAAARSVLGGSVQAEQKIAKGAPEGFANAVAAIIGAVGQLDSSGASISDRAVNVYGKASNKARAERIYDRLKADLDALGFTLKGSVSYPEPIDKKEEPKKQAEAEQAGEAPKTAPQVNTAQAAQCQSRLTELLVDNDIRFATSKAVIKRVSYPVLDALAAALKECGVVRLEIGGHTDDRGSPRYNQGLSEARAVAVRRYFEQAGVNVSAISVYGYGESVPRASNNTHAGRSANRRIEFKLAD